MILALRWVVRARGEGGWRFIGYVHHHHKLVVLSFRTFQSLLIFAPKTLKHKILGRQEIFAQSNLTQDDVEEAEDTSGRTRPDIACGDVVRSVRLSGDSRQIGSASGLSALERIIEGRGYRTNRRTEATKKRGGTTKERSKESRQEGSKAESSVIKT